MADKKIQMTQRNATNDAWDNLYPKTTGDQVVASDGTTTFESHLADYVRQPGYGVTGGSANAYTLTLNPAPTSYVDGMGVVVKIHAANTGASTINVNNLGAKSIVDSKGNALTSGKLRLNGTYSLKYNSTTGNFILQGEGGAGDAQPNDVRLGKKCSTDAGDITGTLDLTNLIAANIKKDVTVGGVTGDKLLYGSGDNILIENVDYYGNSVSPSQLWQSTAFSSEVLGMVQIGSYLFYCFTNKTLGKLNASTGNFITSIQQTDNTKELLGDTTLNRLFSLTASTIACYDTNLSKIWERTYTDYGGTYNFKQCGMAQDANYLYILDEGGILYKVNKSEGSKVWSINTGASYYGFVACSDASPYVYVSCYMSTYFIKRFNKSDGGGVITNNLGYQCNGGLAVDDSDNVYTVNSGDNKSLYKYSQALASLGSGGADNSYVNRVSCINGNVYTIGGQTSYLGGLVKIRTSDIATLWSVGSATGYKYAVCKVDINGVEHIAYGATGKTIAVVRPFVTIK